MMSANFDTLEYTEELKRSGMSSDEAAAITKATQKALGQLIESKEIANKNDILTAKNELMKVMQENTWKTIGILASIQTLVLGIFAFVNYFK